MMRRIAFGLALVVLTACSPPQPAGAPAPETAVADAPVAAPPAAATLAAPPIVNAPARPASSAQAPAGADEAINAWANKQYGDDLFGVEIFYGDFSGDGAPDALARVSYSSGGNSSNAVWPLFRNDGGQMVLARIHEGVYGDEPRNVVFTRGRITLTTRMPRPEDPRCCPTGSQNWTINTN
jgi:hypothetical protein